MEADLLRSYPTLIDNLKDDYLEILYRIIKALECRQGKLKSCMIDKILIDTNLWIYLYSKVPPEKYQKVRKLVVDRKQSSNHKSFQ